MNINLWLEGYALRNLNSPLPLLSPMAGRNSKPLCPCGVHEVAELSERMRKDWAALKGTCWDFTGNRPWFFFCQACHMGIWNGDNRPAVGNRWTLPGQQRAAWQKRGSVARLVFTASSGTACQRLLLLLGVSALMGAVVQATCHQISVQRCRPARPRLKKGCPSQGLLLEALSASSPEAGRADTIGARLAAAAALPTTSSSSGPA